MVVSQFSPPLPPHDFFLLFRISLSLQLQSANHFSNPRSRSRLLSTVYFRDALAAAGSPAPSRVYFVDDSALNIKGSHALGWAHSVLFDEHGDQRSRLGGLEDETAQAKGDEGEPEARVSVIGDMQGEFPEPRARAGHKTKEVGERWLTFSATTTMMNNAELRQIWPEMFKPQLAANGHAQ